MFTTCQDPPLPPTAQEQLNDWRWSLAIYKKTSSAFLFYQLLCSACARGAAAWKTSRRLSQVHLCASAHLENTQAGFSHLNSKPFKPPLGTGLAWLLEEFSPVKLSPDQARPSHTWGGQGCPCAKGSLELCSYVDRCKSMWLCSRSL